MLQLALKQTLMQKIYLNVVVSFNHYNVICAEKYQMYVFGKATNYKEKEK